MIINKEFNLSEKIEENDDDVMEEFELKEDEKEWIYAKDVREFIRLLDGWKEIMRTWHIELPTIELLCSEFDKFKNHLAGDKLI